MAELSRKESKLRRLIGWASAAAVLFASLAALWTGVMMYGGFHVSPPGGMNPGWIGSLVLSVACVAAIGAILYGVTKLSRLDQPTS
ncbi:MAG: hypothetical protein VYE22_07665 [Myxococcota bacterium]|nr:hypothetical protein [Myxococcota bacterium]